MRRENIFGSLEECFKASVPETIRSSYQIIREMKDDFELRLTDFWTSQSGIYYIEDGKTMLRIPFFAHDNPIFKNIDEACKQIRDNGFYRTEKSQLSKPFDYSLEYDSYPICLDDLPFEHIGGDIGSVHVPLRGRISNTAMKNLALSIYDGGGDLNPNRKTHSKYPTRRMKNYPVHIHTSEYVKRHHREGEAIVTPCSLGVFQFSVTRPIRKIKAMQAVPDYIKLSRMNRTEITTSNALDYLLADEERSMREMDVDRASGLVAFLDRCGYVMKSKEE